MMAKTSEWDRWFAHSPTAIWARRKTPYGHSGWSATNKSSEGQSMALGAQPRLVMAHTARRGNMASACAACRGGAEIVGAAPADKLYLASLSVCVEKLGGYTVLMCPCADMAQLYTNGAYKRHWVCGCGVVFADFGKSAALLGSFGSPS